MNIEQYQIPSGASILDAMIKLTADGIDILLVVDGAHRVLGLITDGDLRRGIVGGEGLESPVTNVMSRKFLAAKDDDNRAYALDMMIAQKIRHLPIIGDDGKLKGIHFLSHLVGHKNRPNTAVIMAGGRGVRLRPITENCPKPMIRVAGRPILERLVLHLVSHGITHIYLAINYMGEMIEDYFGDGGKHGCKISYLREQEMLGSGGALSLIPDRPEVPFFVINGDLVTDLDVGAMLDLHDRKQAMATIASKQVFSKISYGVIEKQNDILTEIIEKPTLQHEINIGCYVLSPECLDYIPSNAQFPITDLFTHLQKEKKIVCVYETQEDWIDVGQPEDLKKAMGRNG